MKGFTDWIDAFKAAKQNKMDDRQSQMYIMCVMGEGNGTPIPEEVSTVFLYQVVKKRAEYLQMKISDWACLFMADLAKSPGTIIMYLYYLKGRGLDLTFDGITEAFPYGFPSENDLEKLWGMQKIQGHNLLDLNTLHMWLLGSEGTVNKTNQ